MQQSVVVNAVRYSSRSRICCCADEGLDFCRNRPVSLACDDNRTSRSYRVASFVQKNFSGVCNFTQAVFNHVENADFVRAAKTVFYSAQNAVSFIFVSFKMKDYIDHVFQNLWTCNVSVFRNVTDYNCCNVFVFCNFRENVCAFSDLRNASCSC